MFDFLSILNFQISKLKLKFLLSTIIFGGGTKTITISKLDDLKASIHTVVYGVK